ncbi:MAG TPA: hypothetical protein PKU96_00210 [bacterium]|nr:hypothetical protein [bacterium]
MRTLKLSDFKGFSVVILLLVAVFSASFADAAVFNPKLNWRTIRTEHFKINFPEKIEPVAKKAAQILEEAYPQVTERWDWRPWGQTEVVLVDNTDDSNGMATVLPYNWMLIYVVPPDPDSPLAHYDDWLKMLLIHEFTHIVQIDAYGGIWYPVRVLLGKTVSPTGINPTWLREGIAQYDETTLTEGGRGRGSSSEMIVRTSVLENKFPAIDQADGLSWKWPGYRAAYAYGIMFVHWLVDNYGEEKFLEFDKRVRKSVLLGMINHQARNVYGKTFYELWREWYQSLKDKYEKECAPLVAAGLTEFSIMISSARDEQLSAPEISPDGKKIAYTATSPHHSPRVLVKDLESGKIETIAKKANASQISWSSDGRKLAYSAMARYKRYDYFYDISVYDFDIEKKNKRIKKITNGKRARDPDFSSDGKFLVYVAGSMGSDSLMRYDFEGKKSSILAKGESQFVQFANPRVSNDGKYIAVSVWKKGDGWRVYRYDIDGKNPRRLTSGSGLIIEARPSWSSDDKFVLFASDESGISNIYRVNSFGGKKEMLTNVLTGVFQPVFVHGVGIIAQMYGVKGFEIASMVVHPDAKEPVSSLKKQESSGSYYLKSKSGNLTGVGIGESGEESSLPKGLSLVGANPFAGEQEIKSEKYVAFGKSLFLPRFVIPGAAYGDDAFFATIFTGGTDPLNWHRWILSGTYRSDANYFGSAFSYSYNRFRPSLGFGFRDYAVDFGEVLFAATGRQMHLYEKRRGFFTYLSVPVQRHAFSFGYYYEDHKAKNSLMPIEAAGLNLGKFAGLRGQYRYGDAEEYPASISPENGRTINLHITGTNKIFGSGDRNEQIIFAGDWREYVRLWHHHVLALRASGGITWGDILVQGTFGMGGAIGEGTLASGGSYNYFPFRGLPVSALSRTRAMLFSAEYRFPIVDVLRGPGTVPFFLKDISGALLADYGNAWNAHEGGSDSVSTFFDDFLLSVGAELRANFIIGHGLPIHGRLGYAVVVVNRDRLGNLIDPLLKTNVKDGMLIIAIGTAF